MAPNSKKPNASKPQPRPAMHPNPPPKPVGPPNQIIREGVDPLRKR